MSSHPPLKKLKSLNDLDQAHDDQEIEFLKLQVLEQQTMIDELTRVSESFRVYAQFELLSWFECRAHDFCHRCCGRAGRQTFYWLFYSLYF